MITRFICKPCYKQNKIVEAAVEPLAKHIRKEHNIHGRETYLAMSILRIHSD